MDVVSLFCTNMFTEASKRNNRRDCLPPFENNWCEHYRRIWCKTITDSSFFLISHHYVDGNQIALWNTSVTFLKQVVLNATNQFPDKRNCLSAKTSTSEVVHLGANEQWCHLSVRENIPKSIGTWVVSSDRPDILCWRCASTFPVTSISSNGKVNIRLADYSNSSWRQEYNPQSQRVTPHTSNNLLTSL